MYRFLMEFTHGTTPCHSHLTRRYGNEVINEALEKRYIIPFGVTTDGETKYAISQIGKDFRDK